VACGIGKRNPARAFPQCDGHGELITVFDFVHQTVSLHSLRLVRRERQLAVEPAVRRIGGVGRVRPLPTPLEAETVRRRKPAVYRNNCLRAGGPGYEHESRKEMGTEST